MTKTTIIECDVIYSMTVHELGQTLSVEESFLVELIEHGLLETQQHQIADKLQPEGIQRLKKGVRLAQDLGINAPGVVLAIELMEKVQQLQHELWQLKEKPYDE